MDCLRNRETQEREERKKLAEYALASADSRGRRYLEVEHPYRSCFQRDRDRVIHCAAFRRLEAKTQVFLDDGSDYYRTRLTHTIEVAQIARTAARILSVNEDLAEAAALAHDLGHPPYGHCGEAVLNDLMAESGGFEHNRQSLRVVEYLEHPYPDFRGLNLTYETRECLAKHETRHDHPRFQKEYGPGQAPLEGQIADLADSVAYNSHDLDDALACGLIVEQDLDEIELYQLLRGKVKQQFPQAHRFARQLRCAKGLIDILVSDVLQETARRLKQIRPKNSDEVRKSSLKIASLSNERQKQLNQLEDFLFEKVYHHPEVVRAQQRAREELTSLYERFLREPAKLPQRYQQRIDEQGVVQVIGDYLAGMTDRFCHRLYICPT